MLEMLPVALVLLPLGSSVLGALTGGVYPKLPSALTLFSSFGLLALALFLSQTLSTPVLATRPWFELGSLSLDLGLLYTPLASLMLLIVGWVGFAVVLFSLRYMREDPAQPRYYAALSLFLFAMSGLTLASNMVLLFIFWELVGFTSYLLIGHDGSAEAARAANKAFLANRFADVFFLLGLGWLIIVCQTTDLAALAERFAALERPMQMNIASLFFVGVLAKSAQFPLHIWLPEAMRGPTPVSALIHAATMVAAGVYLLCRLDFVFAPMLPAIVWVGVASSVLAGLWALAQNDLKRVLAYSTISQLGFMVAGFGLGTPQGAFFHLSTHAFFKALLFLCAGAIIDATRHEQDLLKLGGLWRRLPFTCAMFLIGALALSGAPYTAGFFSKEAILDVALAQNGAVAAGLMLASLLTCLYMGRLFGLVFLGLPRSPEAAQAHGGSTFYALPLGVLALFSLLSGYAFFYPAFPAKFLAPLFAEHAENSLLVLWSCVTLLAGVGVAYFYSRRSDEPFKKALGGVHTGLREAFYFDKCWNTAGNALAEPVARVFSFFDQIFVGGVLVRGIASCFGLAGLLAQSTYRKHLTYALYWVFWGALFFIFVSTAKI